MKYYVLKMELAKDGYGIASAARYATPEGKEKKWSTPILFEGTFEECLKEKAKIIRSSK